MKLKKMSAHSLGLYQAVLTALYCVLIANLLHQLGSLANPDSQILMMILFLFLLIFSVAVTGLLVLGYPVYLLINHETKRAWQVVSFTLFYSVVLAAIAILIVMI